MIRHNRRVKLSLVRLEERNAASETLHAVLGNLGIASIFDTSSLDSAIIPSTSLSAVDPSYRTNSSNNDANTAIALNPLRDQTPPPAPAAEGDAAPDQSPNARPSVPAALADGWFGSASWLAGAFSFDGPSAVAGGGIGSAGEMTAGAATPVPQLVEGTPTFSHATSTASSDGEPPVPPPLSPGDTTAPFAGEPADDADGVAAAVEAQAPNHGDGNQDGVLDANQNDVASLRSSTSSSFVTIDGLGHTLTQVRAMAAPVENAQNVTLPMGMFAFELQGVARGGAATARLVLPDGSNPNHYFKQDSTGALQSFDFDGTTGAEFNGNIVTLHFVDGGRGDADGMANGVVVDPGGYGWIDIVTAAWVHDVTFSGANLINIVADPGTPAYPAGPQWVAGSPALPVGYPRNTDAVVSANFTATVTSWPYQPPSYGLMVEGFSTLSAAQPYYFDIPPTTVTLTGTNLYLPPTTVTNPFPTFVNYGSLTINWFFSNDGGANWTEAGQSANELYVTLATPSVNPVYHTLINLSVPISAQFPAGIESRVISQTWQNFAARTVTTRNVNPLYNGLQLRYYGEWDTPSQTSATLLQNLDGQCYAHGELFAYSLMAAGVRDTRLQPVKIWSIVSGEVMLIKNWDFVGNGTANATINGVVYPYQNTLSDPTQDPANGGGFGVYMKKTDGVWGYYWGTTVEVVDKPGLPGQNTANPKSTFSDHTIVKISGTYYDPSYGMQFATIQAWETASVAGFVARDPQGVNNNYRLVFRKDPGGLNVQTDE